MLIVVVIIWILAAALIPKLQSARWKANDVARKANLNQVATALMSYNIDKWKFPETAWWLSSISWELIYAWMSSIPRDPDFWKTFQWMSTWAWACVALPPFSPAWEFMYTPATKWSISKSSYIIMAWSETEWGSNYERTWTVTATLCSTTEINNITRCEWWTCLKAWDNLRYIVTY